MIPSNVPDGSGAQVILEFPLSTLSTDTEAGKQRSCGTRFIYRIAGGRMIPSNVPDGSGAQVILEFPLSTLSTDTEAGKEIKK